MPIPRSLLAGVRFSLVGPGNVGSSLAHWAVASGATINAVVGRTTDSARELADCLGGRPLGVTEISSAEDDLLLIAVDDPQLARVAKLLASHPQAKVALHTSGRFPADVLADLRSAQTSIGSLHPLMPFPRPVSDAGLASGVVFGYDGDPAACQQARQLALAWSGVPIEIPASTRGLYHLGATTAAGGVLTLVADAVELAHNLGLAPEIVDGYLRLAEGALAQARSAASISDAITGPVARGDLEGFQQQLAVLHRDDPELAHLLELLARRTRRLKNRDQ